MSRKVKTKSNTTSEIILQPASSEQHLTGILQLQKRNLFTNVDADQQASEGFVFAHHDLVLLKRMATYLPQVVALFNNSVVGYNLAMTANMTDELEALIPMFNQFQTCAYRGKKLSDYKYIVGGQVCVDRNFRGLGLLRRLYHETRNHVPPHFQLCVTEIARRNVKSLAAHEKMGFQILKSYQDENELWDIVAWDMNNSMTNG